MAGMAPRAVFQDDNLLPRTQRPQPIAPGLRGRVSHLANESRYPDRARPQNFRESEGTAYRNAAIQALINVPLFVNFIRDHRHKQCEIGVNCLLHALLELITWYWSPEKVDDQLEFALKNLWQSCLATFWCKERKNQDRIGPKVQGQEFFTEVFMLQLLQHIFKQLESNPAEHETFKKLFQTDYARKWKCTGICGWESTAYKWESSMRLPVDVQPATSRSARTTVETGLACGLKRWATRLEPRKMSVTPDFDICERCRTATRSFDEIINLPEILILHIKTAFANPNQRINVPFQEKLTPAIWPKDQKLIKELKPHYEMVAGTFEVGLTAHERRAGAFARGPKGIDSWFTMFQSTTEVVPDLVVIDRLQTGSGAHRASPELFIYRRVDKTGVIPMRLETQPVITPVVGDIAQQARNMMSDTISDVFTQRVGRGLLKFKFSMYPAKPLPHDLIDFDMSLGYELGGKNWEQRFDGKLRPLTAELAQEIRAAGEHELRPITRAYHRQQGLSPTEAKANLESFAVRQGLSNTSQPSYPDQEMQVDEVNVTNQDYRSTGLFDEIAEIDRKIDHLPSGRREIRANKNHSKNDHKDRRRGRSIGRRDDYECQRRHDKDSHQDKRHRDNDDRESQGRNKKRRPDETSDDDRGRNRRDRRRRPN